MKDLLFNTILSNLGDEFWIFLIFLFSLACSYSVFPTIIYLSHKKNLMANPIERSSHVKKTPTLGGVGIFISVTMATIIYCSVFNNQNNLTLVGSLIVLFFLGLKDDILTLSAKTKFIGQALAALFVIMSSDIRLLSFEGILGIYELNYFLSLFFSLFVFILIINAFNLIDGLDGLAGTIAIYFSLVLGIYFYLNQQIYFSILSFSLLGALISFLFFNFSAKKKIFMGDTGSMIVGFLIAFLAIVYMSTPTLISCDYFANNKPVLIISLFFYPLLDTLRIFFVRIVVLKKSPFLADKNHIHHKLLHRGFKHWQVAVLISIFTSILLLLYISFDHLNINIHLIITLVLGVALYISPFMINPKKMTPSKNNKKIMAVCFLLPLVFSCTTKKEILYFQNSDKAKFENSAAMDPKIESNDILSIKINSIDIESSKIYNLELIEGGAVAPALEIMKLKGYLVNTEGTITLPVLGVLKVTDKTNTELEKFLTEKLKNEGQLKDPLVTVRVLNAKVTVLGEVRIPGTFTFTEKNLTLLQAIGLAGDLTINGQRTDVLLIRQENNTKTITHIDLTSSEWFNSPSYFVKQNDVIVVNPNNAKIKSAGIIGNTGTLVSIISLLLTAAILIKN
jgi:UDP-N-acetylmuramyl pentapeptide phosphotransferase/UDP-N-acetylglucosamine-1-phosphate transferase/protein involved in polysaccharide export with SLBB domain